MNMTVLEWAGSKRVRAMSNYLPIQYLLMMLGVFNNVLDAHFLAALDLFIPLLGYQVYLPYNSML